MYAYEITGVNPRRRSTMFNKRWIGRNASVKSLKRYCSEIWSNLVRERDQHQCFMCGSKSWLNAHHLISRQWKATAYNTECGITLCNSCHSGNILSAHVSPWFLENKLETERPGQYQWMLNARETINLATQPQPKYRDILGSLMCEYEKCSPTVIMHHGGHKFTKQEESMMVNDFVNNQHSLKTLANKMGCSQGCIWKTLHRYGINLQDDVFRARAMKKVVEACGRKVVKMDTDGTVIQTYISINEAAREHGKCASAIRNCIHGLSKSSSGFLWKYQEENINKTNEVA